MEMTLRWFGKQDTVTLENIRQIPGVTGVISTLYNKLPGQLWTQEEIKELKETVENNGLCLSGTIQDISNLTNKSDEKNPIIEELTKHYSEILAEAEKLNGCDDLKNMIKSGNDIVNKLRM